MGQLSYTTAEVQSRLDSVGTLVRPNLLDNWYFVGGGSQQGGGQFPINQRGQTSYSGNVYGIDRWKQNHTDLTVTLNSGYISLANASTRNRRASSQVVENPTKLLGRTVTGSVLFADGTIEYGTGTFPLSIPSSTTYVTLASFNGSTFRGELYTSGSISFALMVAASGTAQIVAMKVELGDTQTLAHQENGVWVLNEIPNFEQELARCQRYYQTYRTQSLRPTYAADCRPVMRTDPAQSTITVSSTTYYVNSADL